MTPREERRPPTEEELEAEYGMTFDGMLLAAFAEAERTKGTDHAANGRFMTQQLRLRRLLFKKMYKFLFPGEPLPVQVPAPPTPKSEVKNEQQNGKPEAQQQRPAAGSSAVQRAPAAPPPARR